MKIFTMMRTVSKNAAKGPATLMYPQRARVYPAITRGRIENDVENCIFCGMCSRRCVTYAITVAKEKREWQIDRLRCCVCNLCVEVCPKKCLSTASQFAPAVTERAMAIQLDRAPLPEPGQQGRGDA